MSEVERPACTCNDGAACFALKHHIRLEPAQSAIWSPGGLGRSPRILVSNASYGPRDVLLHETNVGAEIEVMLLPTKRAQPNDDQT